MYRKLNINYRNGNSIVKLMRMMREGKFGVIMMTNGWHQQTLINVLEVYQTIKKSTKMYQAIIIWTNLYHVIIILANIKQHCAVNLNGVVLVIMVKVVFSRMDSQNYKFVFIIHDFTVFSNNLFRLSFVLQSF